MELHDYSFRVGEFSFLFFNDGGGPRTASGFLPSAPQDELERIVRTQNLDPNALDFAIKPILITSDAHIIIIDTGLGDEMSHFPHDLVENGIALDKVNLVVITHGHGDHINGILHADGEFVFPNAQYVLWRGEWEYWTAADRFAATDSSHPKRVWQELQAHSERVRLLDEHDNQIVPGIVAVPAPGHTVGQIALEISSEGEKLLHIADAAHHTFQLACPQWSPQFDTDKVQAAEMRRALFERAAQDGVWFSAYHFPFPGIGKIVERDGALTWEPRSLTT